MTSHIAPRSLPFRVLVTGASGFVGAHLCRRLAAEGADVHGISRRPHESDVITWWRVNMTNARSVKRCVERIEPDVVFHLASYVSGQRDVANVLPTLHANLTSTVNLLTTLADIECHRCILAGSLEEPDGADLDPIPSSPYGAAKWASRGYARMFNQLYGLPLVMTRLFMIYGPGQHDIQKLVPYTILSLLRGETPKFSSGERPVDWIYVDDVVDGLIATAIAPGLSGETVELGSGRLVTVRHVVEQLVELIAPGTDVHFGGRTDRPFEQVRVANVERARQLTGWRATTSLVDGLQATIDWYRSHEPSRPAFSPSMA